MVKENSEGSKKQTPNMATSGKKKKRAGALQSQPDEDTAPFSIIQMS